MKITRKSNGIRCVLKTLNAGEVFRYGRKIYIMTDVVGKTLKAVDLHEGTLVTFIDDEVMVSYVQAKVVLL